ncbi:MAG: DNA recombination/repair protein RecA, partial [Candidatus Kerfeldbacteria bacterium]|nr:DNA recombination/repair protein RecA [Candidatus Kerfeldbacteria bacterium]
MPKKTMSDGGGKSAAAQAAIDQIKERFGEGSIMKLGEAKRMNVEVVPTG